MTDSMTFVTNVECGVTFFQELFSIFSHVCGFPEKYVIFVIKVIFTPSNPYWRLDKRRELRENHHCLSETCQST